MTLSNQHNENQHDDNQHNDNQHNGHVYQHSKHKQPYGKNFA
jgi:hypothetical protein